MESEGLKQFLSVVGDAVHSVNTICVGLAAVSDGNAVRPSNLNIGWKTSNPEVSAAKARVFALRSSLVFVEEALLKYFDFLKVCTTENTKLLRALQTEGAVERVVETSKFLTQAEPYWWPIVVLLVRWRNKVVHNSRNELSVHQKNLLLSNSENLKNNHAGIDISTTLNNFETGQITLKDFTTLISITIRYVRALDEQLEPSIQTLDGFIARLKQRDLVQHFNNVIKANGDSTRQRKLNAFLRTEFSAIDECLYDDIYKNGAIT